MGPTAEIVPAAACPSRVAAVSDATPTNESPITRLARGAVLCNEASFDPLAAAAPGQAPRIVGGNGTDKALLAWSLTLGGAKELPGWLCRLRLPFSSVTKQVCVDRTR
jgi:hypothetical protein